MSESKKILIGFVCILVAIGCLAAHSQWQLALISEDTDDLYQHPFVVSNAAQKINFNLVSMHRHMKDVVLANNELELKQAIINVAQHEEQALAEFDLIFDRFLGDKSQINQTYRAFLDWKGIRNEVIHLMQSGETEQAIAITKGKGADHVRNLNLLMEEFVNFAFNKAQEFNNRALSNANTAIYVNLVFSFAVLVLVIMFMLYIRKSLTHAQKDRNYRNHLIDQNIMLAQLDKDGVIQDVSSALCRFLGSQKLDLIGKSSQFFDNSEESEQLEDDVLSQIQTGKEWQGEIKHYDHKGKISWASSKIVPQYDDNFKVIGFTNILVSISNKKLSGVDKLTSMLNRRRYDEIIVHELRVAKRSDTPITLAIVDIDFFKLYNDTYGHPAGDLALQQVSECILSFVNRPSDFAFRIGGEEFAIVFSGLDVTQSRQYLEKVKNSIESLKLPHDKSSVSSYITASFGAITAFPDAEMNEEQLYIEADKALYMAKESRNMVVCNEAKKETLVA
jgi:diguanylate cyclase (GGDEF)-like protein/PAS domain S-box-containing protein